MVPPKLTPVLNKSPCCDATGRKSQRHSFQVRRQLAVIPLLYNGSARIGLLGSGRGDPALHYTFARSTRRSIRLLRFCLALTIMVSTACARPPARLSENRFEVYSSSSAFLLFCWAGLYDGGGRMSRGNFQLSNNHFDGFCLLAGIIIESAYRRINIKPLNISNTCLSPRSMLSI